ncbi:MAG: hypothetical protein LBC19_12970 [Tannerella sp.]|jgi:hypothetical protein|nr:hypothetical protein [Tannerella sp.]
MATVNQLIERLKAFDVRQSCIDVVRENGDAIVAVNQEQLQMGQKKDGSKVGWYRSEQYAQFKNSMNPLPPFRVPDLRLTGAFYAGMKLDIAGDSFVISSSDSKAPDLVEKYGEEILGISEEGAQLVKEEITMPAMRKKTKEALKL